MPDLKDGKTIEVQGSGPKHYVLKNTRSAASAVAKLIEDKIGEAYIERIE